LEPSGEPLDVGRWLNISHVLYARESTRTRFTTTGRREGVEGNAHTHLEHVDVGPCGKDDAIDTENAENKVVRRDAVERLAKSLPRSGRWPASAVGVGVRVSRGGPMCGIEKVDGGGMEVPSDW
jgi:hypothetical protein